MACRKSHQISVSDCLWSYILSTISSRRLHLFYHISIASPSRLSATFVLNQCGSTYIFFLFRQVSPKTIHFLFALNAVKFRLWYFYYFLFFSNFVYPVCVGLFYFANRAVFFFHLFFISRNIIENKPIIEY